MTCSTLAFARRAAVMPNTYLVFTGRTKQSIAGHITVTLQKGQTMTKPRKHPRIMDRHHRLPRSRGGSNTLSNLSTVEQSHHRAWHLLVGNMTAPEAAKMLSDIWIDSNYYLVAVPRKRLQAMKRRKRRYCTDCSCEVLKYIEQTQKEE